MSSVRELDRLVDVEEVGNKFHGRGIQLEPPTKTISWTFDFRPWGLEGPLKRAGAREVP